MTNFDVDTNIFGRIYEIVWSLLAVYGGIQLLFFRERFIARNSQAFLKMYERTKFPLFKRQAEGMKQPYMNILGLFLGIVFLVLGVLLLLGRWHIGRQ